MTVFIAILDAVGMEYRGVDPIPDSDKFLNLLEAESGAARFQVFHVAGNEFPADVHSHDGFLITGSPASVHDRHGWIGRLSDFVRQAAANRRRIFGSCFGHQLIATALGGEAGSNEHGWMIGNYRLDIRSRQPWMDPWRTSTCLYHFNRERVTRLPTGATVYAQSEAYPNFGYVIGDNILSIQGHPEQTAASLRNFLRKTEAGMSVEEVRQAHRKIEDGAPDKQVWASWMMNFFLRGNR